MYSVRTVTDLEECRRIWEAVIPPDTISDLWDVRFAFHRRYHRPLSFVTVERRSDIVGLLPLSYLAECDCYGYFPGETWHGKTWLEQNRLIASGTDVLQAMFRHLDESGKKYHLRYLLPSRTVSTGEPAVDEVGYLFYPPRFDYDMENYFKLFSHKSAKRIMREVEAFNGRDLTMRFDRMSDFDILVRMNLDRYGDDSYFADPRFAGGFSDLTRFLRERGWLKVTTVLIGGEVAAVDVGCIYRESYTLLAGGTNANFPGIAKYINLFHMRRACEKHYQAVDFLCGDFSWKPMFHLAPRPLYLYSNIPEPAAATVPARAVHPAIPVEAPISVGRSAHA